MAYCLIVEHANMLVNIVATNPLHRPTKTIVYSYGYGQSWRPTNRNHFTTSSTAQGGGGSFKNRKPIGEVGCCESGMAERSH